MIDIIKLINYLFSNNFKEFFGILNYHLCHDITDTKIINLIEDIKWYYMFDDIPDAKKEGIKLIKLIYKL
jgi:hypothetical protein